jgi:hypothetical protein
MRATPSSVRWSAVTVYLEPTGGAATTEIIKALAIAAGETKTLQLNGVAVHNGSKLYALADANSMVNLVITKSVVEQSA